MTTDTWLIAAALAALVPLYLLPAYVAYRRGHRNSVAILALNLLLGWTLLGWTVALVWALLAHPDDPRAVEVAHYQCPRCHQTLAILARWSGQPVVCGRCQHQFVPSA